MTEQKSSVQRRGSRYACGGVTEVTPTALEWWERTVFASAPDDTFYRVERKFEGRLDLIAALLLGEPRHWWILAQYNNVLDPFAEIVEGAVLVVPSATRVQAILNGGRTGGVPSTREVRPSILPIV